jgi:hypothetical protein
MNGFPKEEDARKGLVEIIKQYFDNEEQKNEMLKLAEWEQPPIRGILSDLHSKGIQLSIEHQDAVKDIIFLWG